VNENAVTFSLAHQLVYPLYWQTGMTRPHWSSQWVLSISSHVSYPPGFGRIRVGQLMLSLLTQAITFAGVSVNN